MGTFSVALPYQFYNLVMVFVTILALLWGMVAIKRVYRMLRIRSAVLCDRIIQIRGLGSYLTYFDGATRAHLDAVVHTRQSMPPVAMDPLKVSSVVNALTLRQTSHHRQYELSISLTATCRTRVVCMLEFNNANFQRLVLQSRSNRSMSRNRLYQSLTGVRDDLPLTGSSATGEAAETVVFPRFQRAEVCSYECLYCDVAAGDSVLLLPLSPVLNSWLEDRLRAASGEVGSEGNVTSAVLLIPLEAHTPRKAANSPLSQGNAGGAVTYSWRRKGGAGRTADYSADGDGDGDEDGEEEGDEEVGAGASSGDPETPEQKPLRSGGTVETRGSAGTGRNPMVAASASSLSNLANSSPSKNSAAYLNAVAEGSASGDGKGAQQTGTAMFAAVSVHSLPTQSIRTVAAAAPGPWSAPLPCTEVVVLDDMCNAYQSQEIFGLSGVEVQAPSAAPAAPAATTDGGSGGSSAQGSSAASCSLACGGHLVPEDCVVCLTVPKAVLLLPCRHLCVCEACLVFLDKCPVCRAAFDEYVAINAAPSNSEGEGGVEPSER